MSTAPILMPFSDKLNLIMVSINPSRDQLFFTIQRKDAPATGAKGAFLAASKTARFDAHSFAALNEYCSDPHALFR